MRRALQSSGHSPSDVGVVVISACGAPILDRAEAEAVVQVFGPGAIPPCTTAALRAGVAAGMMGPEAVIVAALALREEWIIEIGGRAGPDVDDLIPLVREPVESAVSVALVNSIDPDGACVTLALAR
jgi:3-oxoacyl-(acyl-carrier-protein) synthase